MSMPAATSNAELMARRHHAVARGVSHAHAVFMAHGHNAEIWDVQGRRYIDFTGGISVLNTGHRHPAVMAAVQAQLERYTHTCFQVIGYEPYIALAEKLNAIAPGAGPKKSLFLTTGAEAVENAVKIARAYTQRTGIIAFSGGYHGRTLMTLGLTGKVSPYKKGFGPFPAEVFHALYPKALHGVSTQDALRSLHQIFKHDIEPERTAAIVLEPIQGEGGFHVAPSDFVNALRALCDEYGILLIADEVQTGAGRTGTWFACEQWSVAPDLITTAKSLAGGLPLSGVVGRAEVMDAPAPGGLGGTYAGNPLACAAALAVFEVVERENLLTRSRLMGQHLRRRLQALAVKHPGIAEVRGLGAMVAIELLDQQRQPDTGRVQRILAQACAQGLLLLNCGQDGNVIRIMVPLTASDALIDEGLDILSASVDAQS